VSVLQIVNRQLLGGSLHILWADELVKIMVLWLAMVGSVAATRDNKHIRIDLISHSLKGPLVAWSRVIVDVFAALVCTVIAWQAWRLVQLEMEWGDTVLIDVPVWTVHAILPTAFALLSYRFSISIAKQVHTLIGGGNDAVKT
jgi:TRAP-type C4-dicarboxylate transport system permease small subunit